MSKAQAVRDYLTKHPKALNKDVAEKTGASPQQVSNLRKKMETSVAGAATATKPAAKTGPKPGAKRAAAKPAAASGDFASLVEVKKFAKALGGTDTVRALLDQVDQYDAE